MNEYSQKDEEDIEEQKEPIEDIKKESHPLIKKILNENEVFIKYPVEATDVIFFLLINI